MRQRRPALVILDVWLQGSELDGLQLLDVIRREDPTLPVVMISGHGTIDTAVSAIKIGAYDFIEKPFKADASAGAIDRPSRPPGCGARMRSCAASSAARCDLLGSSTGIAAVRQLDRAGGAHRQPRADHRSVRRRQGSRGAADPSGLEAGRRSVRRGELLGIAARAAGDRAVRHATARRHRDALRRLGTFELAHGGTLLLKEVADLPLETQGKMARVLQEQSFTRVGGNDKVEVDVRVLASTGRALQDEIADGRFREELFHRLNVVPLRVPPLANGGRTFRAGPPFRRRAPTPPACRRARSARTRWRP